MRPNMLAVHLFEEMTHVRFIQNHQIHNGDIYVLWIKPRGAAGLMNPSPACYSMFIRCTF
jgi:hypothetical protein